jgi:hypothetical protein
MSLPKRGLNHDQHRREGLGKQAKQPPESRPTNYQQWLGFWPESADVGGIDVSENAGE